MRRGDPGDRSPRQRKHCLPELYIFDFFLRFLATAVDLLS